MIDGSDYFQAIHDALRGTVATDEHGRTIRDAISVVVELFRVAKSSRRSVFFIGNGGSLAACSHMANDLCLAGVRALALDSAVNMACVGNDQAFQNIFKTQLGWLSSPEDVVVALSCSGESANVLEPLGSPRDRNYVTLSGFKEDNALRKLGHLNFYVPSESYGVVQIAHEAILHCIIDRLS